MNCQPFWDLVLLLPPRLFPLSSAIADPKLPSSAGHNGIPQDNASAPEAFIVSMHLLFHTPQCFQPVGPCLLLSGPVYLYTIQSEQTEAASLHYPNHRPQTLTLVLFALACTSLSCRCSPPRHPQWSPENPPLALIGKVARRLAQGKSRGVLSKLPLETQGRLKFLSWPRATNMASGNHAGSGILRTCVIGTQLWCYFSTPLHL